MVGLAALLGVIVSRPLGRAIHASRGLAWALVVSTGITLAATLTPVHASLDPGAGGLYACDFARVGLPPLDELTRINDTSLNVLLFVPLGITLGLLPRSTRKLALILLAVALPFAIEITQAVAVPLNRTCQSADVFDNLTGLALGLLLGSVAGAGAGSLAARAGTSG